MIQFYPSTDTAVQDVETLLQKTAPIGVEPAAVTSLTLFDTFDWRLHTQGLALLANGSAYTLRDLNRRENIVTRPFAEAPRFIWDIPPGVIHDRLASVLDVRALLPAATLFRQTHPIRLLNADEKTVVRILFDLYRTARDEQSPVIFRLLTIQPVRGYDKAARKVAALFANAGFTRFDEELIDPLLRAAGHEPGSYSPKLAIGLEPDMRADDAARLILRTMLTVMRVNEPYIPQDIDTEFLHDYRVAVRRTRSALSQIKGVFPEEETLRFKQDFRAIGQMSNQLRDLDVYLLSEADYKAQLPDFLRDDLDPFFAYLHSQRKLALERVTAGLNSPEYARILQSWEAFLDAPPSADDTAVNAPLPIFTLARKRIYKRYRQIIKEGYHILEDDRDELLHELRIQCKKLRYLMEFFAGLFPAQKISRLIRQLKQLQGNLGDFNDYCVQEEYLIHVAEEMPMRNKQSRKALVALGVLVGDLHVKREAVKGEFAGTFQHFASPQNEALFVELFAPKKKGGKA